MARKIILSIISLLTALVFIGSVYFTNFDPTNTQLADVFYLLTFIFGLALIILARKDIKKSFVLSYSSPSNSKKTLWGLVYLLVGAEVINVISKYIGGTNGFMVGSLLGVVLIVVYFIAFNFRTKK